MSKKSENGSNLGSLLGGAMQLFSSATSPSPAAAPPTSEVTENSPYDIPLEDLMHLCMKMQKRMQSMEEKQKELIKAKKNVTNDRKALLDLIQNVIPASMSTDDTDLNIAHLQEGWEAYEETRIRTVRALEERISGTS